MATKLEKLSIEELSGVENPANETPGWLVMKSETQEALLKEVDRMESDFAILYAALKSTEDYLGDAPDDVVKAESVLVSYVESLFEGSDDESAEPTPDNETTEAPVAEKSATPKSTRTLMKAIFGGRDDEDLEKTEDEDVEVEEVLHEEESVDEDVEVDDVSDGVEEEEEEDVEKSVDEDLVEVLTRIAKSQEHTAADVAAFRDVLGSVVERIERLEVRKTGLDPDLEEAVAKERISPLRSAVTSAMNGNRVTIS